MRKHCTYSLLLLLIIISVSSCKRSTIEIPALDETFSKKDANPFGGSVAYNYLQLLFARKKVNLANERFENTETFNSDTNTLYVNFSKNYFVGEAGTTALLHFVNAGNMAFISSENIDTMLLHTLGFSEKKNLVFPDGLFSFMRKTAVKMNPDFYNDSTLYSYFYLAFSNNFSSYDKSYYSVLGTNEDGETNFMVVYYGKGRLFLHCEPRAFSNYFLLKENNFNYLQNAFSFVSAKPAKIYWDDYYWKRNTPSSTNEKGGLAALFQYPAMAWALALMLLLLGMYVFIGSKRKQLIVPVISPISNNTIDFADTIGKLYLHKKDNKIIAEKMLVYFLEHIRLQYFLNTKTINEEFVATLSRKTGIENVVLYKLFTEIQQVHLTDVMEDSQLLSLNQQIENFYKKRL